MYINFWYAAVLSEELRDKPIKVRMLGQHFVLFRDAAGAARCLSNVCVHRCGSLGNGWVNGNRVVCPYHGWEYSSDGRCQRIPSLGPDQPQAPPRARVDAYPTEERHGIVFAFLGDLAEEERPPIMPIPEWDKQGWRSTTVALTIKANYIRLVENALDFSHPEFVHFVGNKGADPEYRMPDYDIEHGDWGDGASIRFPRQVKGLWRFFSDTDAVTIAGTTYFGPSQFATRIDIDANMSSYQYAFETPIDLYSTRTFLVNTRNFFKSRWLDGLSDKRNMAIIKEDQDIVEALEPIVGQVGSTTDLSVKADAIQLSYRRRLRDWQDLGWRIDSVALHQALPGTTIHTIPSPGRRDTKSWVFPTVPLIPPRSSVQNTATG